MPAAPTGPVPDDGALVAERKRVLRARMRAVTRALAADRAGRAQRSAQLVHRLSSLVEQHLGERLVGAQVLAFESWRTEVDLAPFVAWCRDRSVHVHLPEMDGDRVRVGAGDVDPATLDVAVVPGLAFTADGRRLGRGGGHYDRLLPRLAGGCLVVGVAFAEQLVEDLPTAPHDAPVGVVVTA